MTPRLYNVVEMHGQGLPTLPDKTAGSRRADVHLKASIDKLTRAGSFIQHL